MARKFAIVSSVDPAPEGKDTPGIERKISDVRGKALATTSRGVFAELSQSAADKLTAQGLEITEFPNPHQLGVGGLTFDVRRPGRLPLTLAGARKRGWRQFVATFAAPPDGEWLRQVEAAGFRIAGRLGVYGVVLEGDAAEAAQLRLQHSVSFVAPYQPAWRISPNLSETDDRIRYLSVAVAPASATDEVADEIARLEGSVETVWDEAHSPGMDQQVIIAEVPAAGVRALAEHVNVRWLDYQPPTYEPEDERTTQVVAGNLDATAPPNTLPVTGYGAQLTALGINGTGVIVAVNDTGVDTNTTGVVQADLAGRVAFAPGAAGAGDTDGHGTHVAGIAVGSAATGDTDPGGFGLGQGVAPGAQLGIMLNPSFVSIAAFSQTASQNNAEIMNCSWGVNAAGGAYSALDAVIDQGIRDADSTTPNSQALVVCFSAGNSGPGATTTTKQTKNAIVVGNSMNARPGEFAGDDDIRSLNNGSSRGPAVDGRQLPNLIAPGTDVISARSTVDSQPAVAGVQRPRTAYTDTGATVHNNHARLTGTSMASPHVAGMCALLVEWWRDRTGGVTPSPAMLKAMLINGAVDCAGGTDSGGVLANIPNSQQGWGRANLRNILLTVPQVQRGPRIFVDQRHAFTANNQTFTLRVAVVDPTRPMRITLVWTDPPANPASATMLVNDLDLRVSHVASGTLFLGNQFNNGFSIVGGARDQLNNVECVYIQAPAGEYDITVRATSVTTNARPPFDTDVWQDFALVADNVERAASDPISVVSVLDRSGSMITSGYVDVTRTAAQAFIDRLRVADSFGQVSFGSSAITEYPAGGTAVVAITGAAERTAASNAVAAIAFGGSTKMGQGLNTGAALLSASTGARGMVLLSDGYDNGTPDALTAAAGLPSDVAVYTCAMGPLSNQALLEQIADTTGGRYYFMPTIDDLFEIHNYISGSLTGDSLVTNESASASSSRVAAWIDPTCASVTFGISWADTQLRHTPNDPKKRNEISIRFRMPNGKLVHPDASYVHRVVGPGHVLATIDDPAPGRWWIEVSTARKGHTRYTAAAFVDSPLRLMVKPFATQIMLGAAWGAKAEVIDGLRRLNDFRVDATMIAPSADPRDVIRLHGNLVRRVTVGPDVIPAPIRRLAAIQDALRKEGLPDPIQFRRTALVWHRWSDPDDQCLPADSARLSSVPGRIEPSSFRIDGLSKATRYRPTKRGSHNLTISCTGTVPGTSAPFVRKEMLSTVVR